MNKKFCLMGVALIFVNLLAGCQQSEKQQPITLTINYPSEKMFYERVGLAFEARYPHIKIKVIEKRQVEENDDSSLDIIFMRNLQEYEKISSLGYLSELTPYFTSSEQKEMNINEITTTMIRSKSDEKLFGLAPAFQSHVIYFNKSLFDTYKIPYPFDGMTWKELFNLAQLFPETDSQGERIYGYSTNYYEHIAFASFLRAGQTEGLAFIDPNTLELTINTNEWKAIGEYIIEAFRSGKILAAEEGSSDTFQHSPIITGRSAMELSGQTTAYNFDNVVQQYGMKPIQWGMVTVPVSSVDSSSSDYYQINEIYGLSLGSLHKDEAWKFIKFIVSDIEYYKKNQNTIMNYGIPANVELLAPITGQDLKPLFSLKPKKYYVNPYEKVHYDIVNGFKEYGQTLFEQVIHGDLTLDQAFEALESEGQLKVNQIKEQLENS
ncbi:ABC transporter substrate-binding protein [Paenibacillus arenilitoris]|uniref:Carbohydrate ABC transporter substrate-binding protein n=1 Tax=Paenibacillus arenilitoris TaxID=2772299 RepID=A0A927CT18_9BACL|nr:ABC transporter substrate-binding protein [Paenibacillus arenilitoris]MBD2872393.1 carbohydrate ABC transporter substrate-binding protein [Paenibacillus arenilitoris]